MKYVLIGMTALLAVMFLVDVGSTAGDKPKYDIKEVMDKAHKSGLLKKIQKGDADKKDREELAELYKALLQSKPPKGDVEEWRKTTTVMHKIAVEAIADPAAGKKLKVNCGACHSKFKG